MEKLKYIILFALFSLVAVLTYTLTKSWFFFDKGIELKEEEVATEEKIITVPHDNLTEDSRILWKNFLYFPTELTREEGGMGPYGYLHHARNLTFVNLSTGKLKKVFDKKVYIWDYFPGDFVKKHKPTENVEVSKEKEFLDIGQKLVIFAITVDTNQDGFLNYKDKMQIFLYDPSEENLVDVLPEEFFLEKLHLNTKKDQLVLIVRKNPNKKEPNPPTALYIYDTANLKGQLVEMPDTTRSN